MESLFVLECSYDKWYIGRAKDVLHQVTYLECGFGPDWTRTYSPIRVVEERRIKSPDDVMTTTKEYMRKYGIDNVRCDTMCSLLPEEYGTSEVQSSRFLDEDFERALRFELYAPPGSCTRCRGTGHASATCEHDPVLTWNCQYCKFEYSTRGLCRDHEQVCPCKPIARPTNSCERCGRHEHTTDRCYERRHVEGWRLE
jgi:predicted GIY-YIG superfamily endonuclease